MEIPHLFLKPNCEKRVEAGHLWIFSNEIDKAEEGIEPGGIVNVYSSRKKFIGRGYCNPNSLISVRLLSRRADPVEEDFVLFRIKAAQALREEIFPGETAYRLVFGESDDLPGLVVDRLGDVFVIQSYSAGADKLLPFVISSLKTIFSPKAILKKSDSALRSFEGIKEDVGVVEGKFSSPHEIVQGFRSNKIKFLVDLEGGQKTGFFFDQRENRARLTVYAKGKTVLDAYSYVGGFGLYAAFAGASAVTCVDSSQAACDLARKNFEINHLKGEVIEADVESQIGRFRTEKRKFDIIVLDPPALAKSKKNIFSAIRKYEKLNQTAMACLNKGGILFTCSCSHHVKRDDFIKIIATAAGEQGKTAKILEMRGQGRDHPILASMPETEYLKCAIVKVD